MIINVFIPTAIVLITAALATISDIRSLKVRNILTLPVLASGLAYHTSVHGLDGLANSGLGVVVGFASMLFLYTMGAMGAGDVKLVAALGAWLGLSPLLPILAIALTATAAYSLFVLFRRGQMGVAWTNLQVGLMRCCMISSQGLGNHGQESIHEMAQSAEGRRRLVPFSVMIGIGVFASLAVRMGP